MELYKTAYDYYKVYLKQRTESFNFFLVLAGFLISATAVIVTQIDKAPVPLMIIAVLLSAALSIVSFLFSRLDNRTKQFLRKTEELLMSYEKNFGDEHKKLFFTTEELRQNNKKMTMGLVFKSIYIMFAVLGLIELVSSIILSIVLF